MSQGTGLAGTGFGQFMASAAGRGVRIVAGIALVLVGVLVIGGTAGWIVAGVGLVPLAAGLFDFCLLTGLVGGLWSGGSVRACARRSALVGRG